MRYKDLQVLKSERDSIQNQRQDLAEKITNLEQVWVIILNQNVQLYICILMDDLVLRPLVIPVF